MVAINVVKYEILTPTNPKYLAYAEEFGITRNHLAKSRKSKEVRVLPLNYLILQGNQKLGIVHS